MKVRQRSLSANVMKQRLLWMAAVVWATTAISLGAAQGPGAPEREGAPEARQAPRRAAGENPRPENRPAAGVPAKSEAEPKPAPGAKEPEAKQPESKGAEAKKSDPPKTASTSAKGKPVRRGPPTLDVRLVEGGTLHLALLDERVEFITPYGRLSVPLADVRRIEFSTRISPEVAERIEKAIRDLSADEFDVREKATADLLDMKERAYAALSKASQNSDPEVARRAERLLAKLRDSVPEERLTLRENDVIHTADSKFTGKLIGDSLKVLTAQFGEQRLKFADVVSLGHGAGDEAVASKNVQADPGTLHAFQAMIGQTFNFRVTGAVGSSLWGTDMYTLDSGLATAAVHAGVVKLGETGVVRVQILGPQGAFVGSARNGVTSSDYGGYPGAYRILSSRK